MVKVRSFNKIAVVDVLNLTEDAKREIGRYSKSRVTYPTSDPKDEEEIIERIGSADAILVSWKTPLKKSVLDKCLGLTYVGVCATNLKNIDLNTARQKGIVVTNVEDYGDEATAEYIFMQLLNLARGVDKYQWKNKPYELNGKTLGIVGLGAVGKEVARLGLGFKMRVLYNSRTRKPEWERKGLQYKSLNELISESEIVTLHVPKDTLIFSPREFDLMPDGSILVNTCLGKVFREQDFVNWIKKGKNYAIFDKSVSDDYYQKFNGLKNVIMPELYAGITVESKVRLSKKVIENLCSFLGKDI